MIRIVSQAVEDLSTAPQTLVKKVLEIMAASQTGGVSDLMASALIGELIIVLLLMTILSTSSVERISALVI